MDNEMNYDYDYLYFSLMYILWKLFVLYLASFEVNIYTYGFMHMVTWNM